MKKINVLAAICSIAAVAVSCNKEALVQGAGEEIIPEGMHKVTLNVSLDDTKITSSTSDGKITLKWNSSAEKVAVLALLSDGTEKVYEFVTAPEGSTPTTTTISCDAVDDGATLYYVLFPYNENYAFARDGEENIITDQVVFPYVTKYTFSQANAVSAQTRLYGKVTDNCSVSSLKLACSLLKLSLETRWTAQKSSKSYTTCLVESVAVSGNNDEILSGRHTLDLSGESPVLVSAPTSGVTAITLEPKTDTKSGLPNGGSYYLPIIPGTYSDGLSFTINYVSTVSDMGLDNEDDFVAYASYTVSGSSSYKAIMGVAGKNAVTISGPFVKSAPAVSSAIMSDEGTLTVAGTADVYVGGVTIDKYTFKYLYRESGTEDEWTEYNANYSEGKISAEITGLDKTKTYSVKAVVSTVDNVIITDAATEQTAPQTLESAVAESTAAEPEGIAGTITFSAAVAADFGTNVVYDATPEDGYAKFINADGEDSFPRHKNSVDFNGAVYSASSSSWTANTAISPTTAHAGCTLTKNSGEGNGNIDWSLYFKPCTSYYTIQSNMLCVNNNYCFDVLCPSNCKITKITCQLVKKEGNVGYDLYKYGDASATSDKIGEIISVAKANTSTSTTQTGSVEVVSQYGTCYTIKSRMSNNRLTSLTIDYENISNN